jgi:GH15 family glucan-1,4-alpha-glucosidase
MNLDLAPIGNCAASALIDREGRFLWACAPRVDSDPVFSALLGGREPQDPAVQGLWSVELENLAGAEQAYLRNTAVLRTVLTATDGAALEVIDFAPRFRQRGRVFRPMAFFRLIRPLKGAPRISLRLRPTADYGARPAERTSGSNHVRYLGSDMALRLTTNAPVSHLVTERVFRLESDIAMHLGPDEPFPADVLTDAEAQLAETSAYWREWVRTLAVPLEWQEPVIRAAITLKLCAYEETGAIVAALTTSLPRRRGRGATGTTATAGSATPTTWCAR